MNKEIKITQSVSTWMDKYLRYTDYLAVAQLYLEKNVLMEKPLEQNDMKTRVLGHWGTVPGLNLIYASLNYLVHKNKCEILFITGPGHGAPAILSNLFAEETLHDFYKEFSRDKKGMEKLAHDFSWPHSTFPSHVTPGVPGSILEGGELGYSLSTAFGAVLDNPNLIVAAVVGDGESESGPLAAAWHSNKFLNPKTSGAVLPIIHINGYKISNPTILGSMSNKELKDLYKGYGYDPIIVEGKGINEKMLIAVQESYAKILEIQKLAREKNIIDKPKWPVIVFKSAKGARGIKTFAGKPIESSFNSHGIPIADPKKNKEEFTAVKKWLESYKISELVDKEGKPKKDVIEYLPEGKTRIGMVKSSIGGNIYKKLSIPDLKKHEVKAGNVESNVKNLGNFLAEIFRQNKDNFRLMCPDEIESNKLGGIFKATKRAYVWPLKKNDEDMAVDGRAMEILSEHTLQGWLQGYILTGRHGVLANYEAFTTIISSMVDQYAKFIKQSKNIPWRKPVSSPIYLETSLGWRQEHNGYSHQNPSFLTSILTKHEDLAKAYLPADTNSLLVQFKEAMELTNSICVFIAGKRDLPQYLTLEEAIAQSKDGLATWDFVTSKQEAKNPDVVLASTGHYLTQEAISTVKLCKEYMPEMKIRYVNVSELTPVSIGKNTGTKENNKKKIEEHFTKDKGIVFAHHGYANDIERIVWPYINADRMTVKGYKEQGSTTTPFDLKLSNEVSRYHLAIEMIKKASEFNNEVKSKAKKTISILEEKITDHLAYIKKHGDDPEDTK